MLLDAHDEIGGNYHVENHEGFVIPYNISIQFLGVLNSFGVWEFFARGFVYLLFLDKITYTQKPLFSSF
jgi:hypothetical protein